MSIDEDGAVKTFLAMMDQKKPDVSINTRFLRGYREERKRCRKLFKATFRRDDMNASRKECQHCLGEISNHLGYAKMAKDDRKPQNVSFQIGAALGAAMSFVEEGIMLNPHFNTDLNVVQSTSTIRIIWSKMDELMLTDGPDWRMLLERTLEKIGKKYKKEMEASQRQAEELYGKKSSDIWRKDKAQGLAIFLKILLE